MRACRGSSPIRLPRLSEPPASARRRATAALFHGPIETKNQPPKQTKIEAPKAPEAPVRAGGERYHPEQVGLAPRMGAVLSRGGADLSNRRHPRYSPRAGRHSFALRA